MSNSAPFHRRLKLRSKLAALLATVALTACQSTPTTVPDSGPPPRPRPPLGAVHGMYIPPADPDTGERTTPNSNIDRDEVIWHYRSAFNVGALNCVSARYVGMSDYYNAFLKNSSGELTRVNKALDARFKAAFPAVNGLRVRDTHTTELYNYFSLPPTIDLLCDLIYSKAPAATTLSDAELYPYAKQVLDDLDAIFIKFYEDYEDYLRRLAEWDALYGVRGEVIVGGGALYSDTPVKPAAISERTGASFENMPAERPTVETTLPATDSGNAAQLPDGYQPSTTESSTPPAGNVSDPYARPAGE